MSEPTRMIRVVPEVIEQSMARTHDGYRLDWQWGEPDTDGFYEPTATIVRDDRLGELDAAWAAAEAALPEGWALTVRQQDSPGDPYAAIATGPRAGTGVRYHGGPTPAAALRALAEKLRERAG